MSYIKHTYIVVFPFFHLSIFFLCLKINNMCSATIASNNNIKNYFSLLRMYFETNVTLCVRYFNNKGRKQSMFYLFISFRTTMIKNSSFILRPRGQLSIIIRRMTQTSLYITLSMSMSKRRKSPQCSSLVRRGAYKRKV